VAFVNDTHLVVNRGLSIPLAEIELRASRSSGPGGQHANKTESRVEAVFDVAASESLGSARSARIQKRLGPVVRAVAQDARSQSRNRELALTRLGEKVESALTVRRSRVATKPTRAAKTRRLQAKRVRSDVKANRRRPSADE
jgi:ribosome-associated protein